MGIQGVRAARQEIGAVLEDAAARLAPLVSSFAADLALIDVTTDNEEELELLDAQAADIQEVLSKLHSTAQFLKVRKVHEPLMRGVQKPSAV